MGESKQILSDQEKENREAVLIAAANAILEERAVHHKLGITSVKVRDYRRKEMNLTTALVVLFHAGKIKL
ncbi:MAG: hypothetical protein VYB38_14460 [Bacteroidota bacterium]|nr:hypothetical protein [Bacteroidota bacterium]MEC8683864.1 hypothetical protein [Bacteroidota bacterium]MEC8885406.1 hypothetical protein [Bacteroidota bacterium]MEE3149193.1 hypothetical protein [Bacteroidota bacterium]